MPYAMSVIVSRAIPEIDGFKPSQRKVLYTMYRMGLLREQRAKSADIVGQTMAFNPHGDQTIYETMVRMTRGNEALLHPWIDSKGNMGKVYSRDMQYAAYRYTEARLDKSCEILFQGLEKDAVDFVDNYSGSLREPVLLPAALPTILLNANQGIAVGMASNIPSFNLKEVCEATRALIKNPQADLLEIMPAPDFSTAASIIYDRDQMAAIYETGRGSFKIKAKCQITKKPLRIEILEIPYTTTIEAIIEDINKNIKNGKLKEIIDVRDETDLKGLRITLDLKKNSDADLVLKKLYALTPLISSFACNCNILVDNKPGVLGVRDILLAWLAWRRVCLARELAFDKSKLEDKLHLVRALEAVLLDIDRAIRIIRRTEKEEDVVPHLMAAFAIDETQAEYVAEIKLRHLNREYLLRRTQEITALEDQIHDLEAILQDGKRLDQLIATQLKTYANSYGKDRKTQLVPAEHLESLKLEPQIEDYNLKLFFTQEGYLKKLPLTSLRSAGDLKVKDDDQIIQELETSNKSEVLFFSDRGNVYKLFCYEIDDHKPSQWGEFAPNILDLEAGEKILFIHASQDFSGYLLLVFADGRMVKVAVDSYATKNKRKKLVNGIYGKAPLKALFFVPEERGNGDMLALSSQNRMILLDTDLVPYKKTRSSQGIQALGLKGDNILTQAWLVSPDKAEDYAYYRVRSLPAYGRFLKDDLLEERQMTLELEN
ncbi:MAG: DNA topoisomerase (ATP-hydrolyzing) subunit A [Eubacteriales bacterium]|nr:DNA topoisomerase (ATP-hydrolyzing) subunit A [Clostridiales bacterium]MDY5836865.1 DNA topoisomerase (ATP-hydrolyzing) subunit A [Eubacteriales bacterium]